MRAILHYILFAAFVVSIATEPVIAQKRNLKKAQSFYLQNAFSRAIPQYQKVLQKGDTSVNVMVRLADAYYYALRTDSAQNYYEAAVVDTTIGAQVMYRYIEVLRSVGNNQKASYMMGRFAKMFPTDERAISYVKQMSNTQHPFKDRHVELQNLALNTPYSDYGGFEFGKGMVFVSNRQSSKNSEDWTGNSYATLFQTAKKDKVKAFPLHTEKNFIDDGCIISNNGKELYVTRCEVTNRGVFNGKKIFSTLKIYRYKKRRGNWIDKTLLAINSDLYNIAHPAVDAKGEYLYFVSDMPNGYGKSDIYRCKIVPNGKLGSPENLGADINTAARETYISIGKDNRLYFASDGYWGHGGLDIYTVDLNQKKPQVVNMGAPINSAGDDFGLHFSQTGVGYLSSNRKGGIGGDDIYKVSISAIKRRNLAGYVTGIRNKPVVNATLTLMDDMGMVSDTLQSDKKGHFNFTDVKWLYRAGKPLNNLSLSVSSVGYEAYIKKISAKDLNNRGDLTINLQAESGAVATKTVSEKSVATIYFDTDKYNIRLDQIDTLIIVAAKYRNKNHLKLTVAGHADTRGTLKYNQKLSENRAKAVVAWFKFSGISINPDDIEAHAYKKPIATNKTEKGRAKNRRVEIHLKEVIPIDK